MPHNSAGEVTFLSNHYWRSARRAGFHGLAAAFADAGWKVRFVTTGLSQLSFLRSDPRIGSLNPAEFNRWITGADGVMTFVYCPLVHPFARSHGANLITDGLFSTLYRTFLPRDLRSVLASSDVIVFESSAALLLFDTVAQAAPRARLVYRVSDDVRVVGMSPSILRAERDAIPRFDLISVPSRVLLKEKFAGIGAAQFHPHGLDLPRLAAARDGRKRTLASPSCVALGTTLFDPELVALCAKARPDIRFYIVGALPEKNRVKAPNIEWCGERPFQEALELAASCDLAAAFYRAETGTEYLAETSNKIAQYTFFRKPIIGPRQLADPLRHRAFFAIDPPTEDGARSAIGRALQSSPPEAAGDIVRPWSVVRDEVIEGVGLASRAPAAASGAS